MKIILACISDWSNLMYNVGKALKAAGADCDAYHITPHPFGYSETSTHTTVPNLQKLIAASPTDTLVILLHGEIFLLNQIIPVIGSRPLACGFTGSLYRRAPEAHNRAFNPHILFTLTDECEFMQLGAKNIHYFAAPFEMSGTPKFGHEISAPYKVGHFPSNPEVKGTDTILQMLDTIRGMKNAREFTFLYSPERVSHYAHLRRMNECDIYIELFQPTLGGKPYGCWGVTAFEAAAAGKIVVTQNINLEVYEKAYRDRSTEGYRGINLDATRICPFFICNTPERFIDNVFHLLELDPKEISQHQTDTYNWITKKHNFEATGKYLLSIFKRYLR